MCETQTEASWLLAQSLTRGRCSLTARERRGILKKKVINLPQSLSCTSHAGPAQGSARDLKVFMHRAWSSALLLCLCEIPHPSAAAGITLNLALLLFRPERQWVSLGTLGPPQGSEWGLPKLEAVQTGTLPRALACSPVPSVWIWSGFGFFQSLQFVCGKLGPKGASSALPEVAPPLMNWVLPSLG